jgi:Icc-related predicted phosphoesterase
MMGDAITLHRHTRRVLGRMLAPPRQERPVVVVTHHAPHPLCLPPVARSAWAVGISVSDLSALIEGARPALWVHGHIHARVDISHVGTRIVCSAAGRGSPTRAFSRMGSSRWTSDLCPAAGLCGRAEQKTDRG